MQRWRLAGFTAIALASTLSCTTPSDGRSSLFEPLTRNDEIRIGEENFGPVLQARGGIYTLDPRLSSYVSTIGNHLAEASGVDLPWEFVIINNSLPNAWSLPGGKIAVSRGLLLELNDEAELAAVLGHEVAHAAGSHAARAIERGMLIDSALRTLGLKDERSSAVDSGVLGIQIIQARYSQSAEFEADADGLRYMALSGFKLDGAVDLHMIMQRESGTSGSNWTSGMTATHPPSSERLAANRELAERLTASGYDAVDDGGERYQWMTRRLRETEAAYIDSNVAIWELSRGNMDAAYQRIDNALSIENREARFHSLLADYYERAGNPELALEEHDVAVRLEPEYHAIHQARGMLLKRMQRLDEARASLEIANRMLQDAETHEALGDIAVAQGRINDAIGHYTVASRSHSNAGQRADEKLRALEDEAQERQATEERGTERDSRRQSPN